MSELTGACLEKPEVSVGFIPLTDCAPLVVAKEKGLFEKHGLRVSLSKETSWANIRDKVALGILDGAQMLAPMVLAMNCGVGPVRKAMVTALNLDLNGNAITVSIALYDEMCQLAPEQAACPATSALALAQVVQARRVAGRDPLVLATVFPTATHTYELRYWMASAGIDPDRDVRLVVIPPPQMPSRLSRGEIDGYCVGEPWNASAVEAGIGRTLITKYELWNNSPEKVLGVTHEWAEQHPGTHRALVMALLEAAQWLDVPAHRGEAAELLACAPYVQAPKAIVEMPMRGTYRYGLHEPARSHPDFNVFYRYAASFPWRSHAVWFLTQMVRWGQLALPVDFQAVARAVYRCDIFRECASQLGLAVPNVDHKTEGSHPAGWTLPCDTGTLEMGPDAFVDGRGFDPHDPMGYLAGFGIAPEGTAARVVPLRSRERKQS